MARRPTHHLLAAALAALLLPAGGPRAEVAAAPAGEESGEARLLRFPDVHGDTVVFSHGGDLWTAPAAGGPARRLTSGEGLEIFPRFSPDGRWIAFTGQYDGSTDVYVIPASGGVPRRLTWYPSRENTARMGFDDMVLGWTPDGKIIFRGQRNPFGGFVGEPWTVRPEGGPVERFPLPVAGFVSFSPDGKRAAITRVFRDFRARKRYQGGQQQDVFLYDLATHGLEKITDWRGTDTQPMWVGGAIYFLSDRAGWKVNLWRYDLATRATTQVTRFEEFDCKWAHASADRIVFENGGRLYLLDPREGTPRRIAVSLADDERDARPRWIPVADRITSASLAPDGKRVAFTARGDVFTVPAQHGDVRNLTRTQGVRERDAVWSPDGRWIAYLSDATGEEELYVVAQDGRSPPRQLGHGPPSWHFPPVWSPDSTRIAWADRGLRLWWIALAGGEPHLAVTAPYREISRYAWSPDARFLAFATETEARTRAIFVHDTADRRTVQVTADGLDCDEPVFDPEGRWLFLLSDRDVAPTLGRLDRSYTVNAMTRPHAIPLRADLPSPFAPLSDEARPGAARAEGPGPGGEPDDRPAAARPSPRTAPTRIDFAGIQDRIVPFPVAPGNDGQLSVAKGKVAWLAFPTRPLGAEEGPPHGTLHLFDLEKRTDTELLGGLQDYGLTADGARVLYRAGKAWGIADAKEGAKVGDGTLDLAGLRMELDPRAEWAQIFAETWRLYRDFFYLADMGKLDWAAIRARYAPLLRAVTHRFDLTYVLSEMAGELGTGHTYVGGGDMPHPERMPVGVLGADLEPDAAAGRWRIARILPGQSWVEGRTSPLAVPGVKVSAGEYLLAIDGAPLTTADEPYRLLARTAGRTISLTVNGRPTLEGAREIRIVPAADEWELRYSDWVESNRRRVDAATGGRVGYVHLPDMGARGLTEFIRQFYPQAHRDGLIVDVRSNGGGFVSQMILERLRRRLAGMSAMRGERPTTYPSAAVAGPMVCITDPYSASDGDIFPYFFRAEGLGPIVGERTWGGVVGIRGLASEMVDGGYTEIPEFGIYDLRSRWVIENEGVSPDVEVDDLPADVLAGHDAQLERAIAEVMKQVRAAPAGLPPPPPSKDLRSPPPLP